MNAMRHVILGLFFVVTFAVLGVVTIYLGDFSLGGRSQHLVAHFDQVDALAPGDPVFVFGVHRGRVTRVAFNAGDPPPEKRLSVEFKLDPPLEIKAGYLIEVGSPNFLGGRQLDIWNGEGAPISLAEYGELRGKSAASMVRQLTSLLGENRADLRRIVSHVANMAEDVDLGKRAATDLLLGSETHAKLAAAIASGQSILAKADGGEGSIGRALNSPALHDAAVGFLKNGEALFGDAKTQPGAIHLLVYDAEFAEKLRNGVAGLSEAAARVGRGEGLLGKVTTPESEATWNDVKSIAADVRSMAADARAGKGGLGKLLSDPEVEQQISNITTKLSGIATDGAVLIDGVRRGRGMLGLLLTDDQARRTLERIVDQVARTIEDAREAAPVSSVASFLFGNL